MPPWPWHDPTFLNAFPLKVYDPSSANTLRRVFTLLLFPALVAYLFFLIISEQGTSATTSFAPASFYSSHSNSLLIGAPGALVNRLWEMELPSTSQWCPGNTCHSWPGAQIKQYVPEIPLEIRIYGSVGHHATVTQSINYYSRCGYALAAAFPALDLPNLPLGQGTSEGFKATIITDVLTGSTTVSFDITSNTGGPVTSGPHPWPGDPLVSWAPDHSDCSQCDDSLSGGLECNNCWVSVRTKLCGMSMPALITDPNNEDVIKVSE